MRKMIWGGLIAALLVGGSSAEAATYISTVTLTGFGEQTVSVFDPSLGTMNGIYGYSQDVSVPFTADIINDTGSDQYGRLYAQLGYSILIGSSGGGSDIQYTTMQSFLQGTSSTSGIVSGEITASGFLTNYKSSFLTFDFKNTRSFSIFALVDEFSQSLTGTGTIGTPTATINLSINYTPAVNFTPTVPEPAAWLMIILGVGTIGAVTRRSSWRARLSRPVQP